MKSKHGNTRPGRLRSNKVFERVAQYPRKYAFLLVSLVAMLLLGPLFDDDRTQWVGDLIVQVAMSIVVIAGVVASRERRGLFWTGAVMGVLVILSGWGSIFVEVRLYSATRYLFLVAFFGTYAVMILVSVVKDCQATVQAIHGGVCAYLLMGLAWAYAFAALECFEVEPLDIPNRRVVNAAHTGQELTANSQLIYFSFVTMSSLGYGDITPRTPLAETFTWMESVTGQMYLAIFIAWAINMLGERYRDESESDG